MTYYVSILTIQAVPDAAQKTLHIAIDTPTPLAFDFVYEGLDYRAAIEALCAVAPCLLRMANDLASARSAALEELVGKDDLRSVSQFLKQYAGRVPDDLLDKLG